MRETLKMMKQIIIGNEKERSIQELILEYKEFKSPNILAYLFVNNYSLIYTISNKYSRLQDEDKASLALQILDKCLLAYNDKLSNFITYFYICYENSLQTQLTKIQSNKYKITLNCFDISDFENTLSYRDDYNLNVNDIINNSKLNKLQSDCCVLFSQGYTISDISKILNISVTYVYKLKQKIKEKILKNSTNFA